jgi:membrane fusion protein, multidrug efflux system
MTTTTDAGEQRAAGSSGRRGRRPAFLPLLMTALLVPVLFAGCSGGGEEAEGAVANRGPAGRPGGGPPERTIPVSGQVVTTGSLQITLRGSTNLRARQQVEVIPKQGGVIAEIVAEEGTRVREGDLLARLDDEEWRLQAQQAQAQATSAAEAAQRGRVLAEQQLISAQEVERLVADSAVAAANYGLADLRVRNGQIRSPIRGIVTHRYVERGAQVGTANPVFAIADVDQLEALVAIPEREANRVVVGQQARILVQEGGSSAAIGTVERIRPVVDPASGTVQVTVTVNAREDSRLRPGQFVNVDIVTEELQDRITLPRTAVLVDGAAPRVYLVQGTRAIEREVTLGYSRGDQVEIPTGIEPGDTVIVVGQDNVRANSPIQLMNLDGAPVQPDAAPQARESARSGDAARAGGSR